MALRWDDVELANGVICDERADDERAHLEIEPKSRADRRTIPIVGALRDILVDHEANQDRADAARHTLRRCSRREVDLFDFLSALVGRIQLRR